MMSAELLPWKVTGDRGATADRPWGRRKATRFGVDRAEVAAGWADQRSAHWWNPGRLANPLDRSGAFHRRGATEPEAGL